MLLLTLEAKKLNIMEATYRRNHCLSATSGKASVLGWLKFEIVARRVTCSLKREKSERVLPVNIDILSGKHIVFTRKRITHVTSRTKTYRFL